jgi:hypothetical protein
MIEIIEKDNYYWIYLLGLHKVEIAWGSQAFSINRKTIIIQLYKEKDLSQEN